MEKNNVPLPPLKALACPSKPLPDWDGTYSGLRWNTYGVWNLSEYLDEPYRRTMADGSQFYVLARIPSPSRMTMLADTLNNQNKQSYTFFHFQNLMSQPLVSFRHGSRVNVWYPDGHAAGRSAGEFKTDMFDCLTNPAVKPWSGIRAYGTDYGTPFIL
ncbi:hypothetical protein SDC9_155530 [bioreactor metagenome]|uniref:Uncharacterized protein n=1 Tax=bioreactor metagenome TaxID=1076179 RepID=A0A645F1R3_9ZZZZ